MNILYINGDKGNDLQKQEGYYTHIVQMLIALKEDGNEISLITIGEKTHVEGLRNDIIFLKHKYMRFFFHKIFPYTGFLNSINILFHGIKLNKTKKFDIIHDRFGLYSFGGLLLSKILRIPLLTEVNGPVIEEKPLFTKAIEGRQLKIAKLLRKICFDHSDAIYCVSNILKDILTQLNVKEEKITVIPNGVDTKLFLFQESQTILREKLLLSTKKIYLLYCGTLHVWYDIPLLIQAINLLIKKIPTLHLLLIGDGQDRIQLENLIKKLKISSNISFLGKVNKKDIPYYLKSTDILIAPYKDLPTGFFGSPIKIFEYMASGTPLVSSNIGQIGEIIDHKKTGLLYETGNLESIVNSIEYLIANKFEAEKIGKQGQEMCMKNYTWRHVSKQLMNLYNDEINEQSHNEKN